MPGQAENEGQDGQARGGVERAAERGVSRASCRARVPAQAGVVGPQVPDLPDPFNRRPHQHGVATHRGRGGIGPARGVDVAVRRHLETERLQTSLGHKVGQARRSQTKKYFYKKGGVSTRIWDRHQGGQPAGGRTNTTRSMQHAATPMRPHPAARTRHGAQDAREAGQLAQHSHSTVTAQSQHTATARPPHSHSIQSQHGHRTVDAQSPHRHSKVTSQSQHTVTARSPHSHRTITAQSQHSHSTVTAQSQQSAQAQCTAKFTAQSQHDRTDVAGDSGVSPGGRFRKTCSRESKSHCNHIAITLPLKHRIASTN